VHLAFALLEDLHWEPISLFKRDWFLQHLTELIFITRLLLKTVWVNFVEENLSAFNIVRRGKGTFDLRKFGFP
jgi:hypothetical protein